MAKCLVFASALALLTLLPAGAQAQSGCIVYQHRDFGGAHWQMQPNSFMQMGGEPIGISRTKGYYRPDWNDQISSFKVFGGCTITLWEHVGRTGGAGHHFRSNRSYSYVGGAWNDKTSWVDCNCPR
jgi:hypothetical protein